MTRLVYIGGYGRSGSTLLEYLLTASPNVIACGEVVACANGQSAELCSCGEPREVCPVWGKLLRTTSQPVNWSHLALTKAVLDQVTPDDAIVVDSSKTAWGSFRVPFALQQELGKRFGLIHVVRDPHGVCWSNVTGRRRRRGKLLPEIQYSPMRFVRHARSVLGWWVANIACEFFRRRHPDRYVRVRYEDLASAPDAVLDTIFRQLELGPKPDLGTVGEHNNRHQLFGSRVRFTKLSPTDIRPDTRWRSDMKPLDRWVISALTWPLRWRYSY
ncbi:sulfotransferase [Methyloceanibacter sp. wino2]|uniref:sulfotransferase family protein n=1 Tax=Methyloceanibacter sp. wino2 TaxID=2170729 RepID=UPI00131F0649|nr:sulfotransferase [Methyloceanibacter sp. wino2]